MKTKRILAIGIDGGYMSIIECIQGQDAVCTATATSGNTGEVGTSYQIIVDYYYDDRICVWGNDITFRLTKCFSGVICEEACEDGQSGF